MPNQPARDEGPGGDSRKDSVGALPDSVTAALVEHRRWVETGGTEGEQADFSGADLSRLELTAVQLQNAKLVRAKFRATDLTRAELVDADLAGAWLQGADLHQADLRRANLAGAKFRDANLSGADLTGARGLLPGRIAGANLAGAKLPEEATRFVGLVNVAEASKTTQGLFYSILFICAYAWLTVASTRDPQLLNNNTPTASRLPILGTDIPLVQFYLVAPLLLLREQRSPLTRWQIRMTMFLGWGLVPLTLLVLWARYLRSHDWWITSVHIFLLSVALGAGLGFRRLAASTLRGAERRPFEWKRAWADARARGFLVTTLTCLFLALISFGSIEGVNPLSAKRGVDLTRAGWSHTLDPRVWVPRVLEFCKVSPFAQLDDSSLSTKPTNWSGGLSDHEIDSVRGADCEGRNLRYAMAYNTFGVNGYFKHVDAQASLL